DQTGLAIAIDFFELVLIDQPIAAGSGIAGLATKRPKNRQQCRGGHRGKNDPKCHYAKRLSLFAMADELACRRWSLLIRPPARLHHGANTAAMGVRARQFRTVAGDPPTRSLTDGKLKATQTYCGEPPQTAPNGGFAAFGAGPHAAPRSLGNCA